MTMIQTKPTGRRPWAPHGRGGYLLVLSLVVGLAVAGCGRKGPLKPLKSQTPVLALPTRGAFCCAAERF
jgi:hypothetical protein